MFFDTWAEIVRIIVLGVCAYAVIVFFLRLSGKRTLSAMNAVDLVITVAIGNIAAMAMLTRSVSLVDVVMAVSVLAAVSVASDWLGSRSSSARKVLEGTPTLIFHEGRFLDEMIRRERMSRAEVRVAVRSHGIGSLDEVAAVVLEASGHLSVIRRGAPASNSALEDVEGFGSRPSGPVNEAPPGL